jgi:hypothetical protein
MEMKTYKVWAKSVTYYYALIEADNYEAAQEQAHELDGSTFIEKGDGDWDIYSVDEVTND